MEHTSKKASVLVVGILCSAFALSACSNKGDLPLPQRDSAEGRTLYEECLKVLPQEQAGELRRTRTSFHFSEMARHNDLLQNCLKLKTQSPVP